MYSRVRSWRLLLLSLLLGLLSYHLRLNNYYIPCVLTMADPPGLDALAEASKRVQERTDKKKVDLRQSWFDHSSEVKKNSKFVKRDKQRLQRLIFEGKGLEEITKWGDVKKDATVFWEKFLHQDVNVKFLHIKEDDEDIIIEDEGWINDTDFLVVHGDAVVYLAIPSPTFVLKSTTRQLQNLGLRSR